MGDAARLADQVARPGLDDLVADLGAHAAADDEAVLVLVLVGVHRRRERPGGDRVLDQREAPAGLVALQQVARAQAGEVGALARARGVTSDVIMSSSSISIDTMFNESEAMV